MSLRSIFLSAAMILIGSIGGTPAKYVPIPHVGPTEIIIDGKKFIIYYNDKTPYDLSKLPGHVVGYTDCDLGSIQVSPNEEEEDIKDTLWHEAKHAANGCSELNAKTYDQLYEVEVPEELLLMKSNPQLIEYLSETSNNGR